MKNFRYPLDDSAAYSFDLRFHCTHLLTP